MARFEYLEIRNAQLELIGIIDDAASMIWHSTYYGIGDFSVEIAKTKNALQLLRKGNFVTRYDCDDIGIIKSVESGKNAEGEKVLNVSGLFAKELVNRRLIYQLSGSTNRPTIISGNVQTAVRELVSDNAINCPFDSKRNISILELGAVDSSINEIIVDESGKAARKQVSYQNLQVYTDELLQEYEIGARVIFTGSGKLQYVCYKGRDLSENIIFGVDFDNLIDISISENDTALRTTALVGGAGEGLERFYSLIGGNMQGLERREVFIDDSGISRTYKDEAETEQEYTAEVYKGLLDADAAQKLADMKESQVFACALDFNNTPYNYREHYNTGDIVMLADNELDIFMPVRILEITEVRDSGGYTVDGVIGV